MKMMKLLIIMKGLQIRQLLRDDDSVYIYSQHSISQILVFQRILYTKNTV